LPAVGLCSSIYHSLKVFSVSILERSTLTDLYCYRTEIRSETSQSRCFRTWVEIADDTGEIVLLFGREALDSRNGIDPNPVER
jgi:hypothetical protein